MSSGGDVDAWYAISLITYQRDLAPFRATDFWPSRLPLPTGRGRMGKVCPLLADWNGRLYPALPRFRAHCASVDPDQVFINDFTRRVLGFSPPPTR